MSPASAIVKQLEDCTHRASLLTTVACYTIWQLFVTQLNHLC